ncbi:pyridoxamine 5'-phosphate oxidase family protein [Fulvivirga sediminis]|uniref:Pyridoxamine 5'-phosphate oxidase family protein n=1 Tax=Fulvivirga sediminis TaxID=2803949 RepID=A0A937JZN0_9BACT|nr:pyridoxamine 5'-phosphate oxidase family protein [Fulvivirga sediminis]MBL3655450.1 pyridoxamine 5'-phosphate oxidase family protein [Fulvivirga sediminis]
MDKLKETIASIEVAMLATKTEEGDLVTRPMYTLHMDQKGYLWFFTSKDSPKMDDIEENNHVNVGYADVHSHTYASVSGTAICVDDEDLKSKLWNESHKAWYPKGVDDPNLCLLRVAVSSAEVWDNDTAKMISVLSKQPTT